MNDHQVTLLAAAISTAGPLIAIMIGIFLNSRQIDSLRREMEAVHRETQTRFNSVDARFDSLERVFTEKLLRVEQVMDTRLSHLEQRER